MTNNDKTKNYESSDDGNENEKKYIYIYRDRWMALTKKKWFETKLNKNEKQKKCIYIHNI